MALVVLGRCEQCDARRVRRCRPIGMGLSHMPCLSIRREHHQSSRVRVYMNVTPELGCWSGPGTRARNWSVPCRAARSRALAMPGAAVAGPWHLPHTARRATGSLALRPGHSSPTSERCPALLYTKRRSLSRTPASAACHERQAQRPQDAMHGASNVMVAPIGWLPS